MKQVARWNVTYIGIYTASNCFKEPRKEIYEATLQVITLQRYNLTFLSTYSMISARGEVGISDSRTSRLKLGISWLFAVQWSCCSWNFSLWGDCCGKWLEICVTNKPVEHPLQIAECVLESFGPIFLFIKALGYGVTFNFVIFNPARKSETVRQQ